MGLRIFASPEGPYPSSFTYTLHWSAARPRGLKGNDPQCRGHSNMAANSTETIKKWPIKTWPFRKTEWNVPLRVLKPGDGRGMESSITNHILLFHPL